MDRHVPRSDQLSAFMRVVIAARALADASDDYAEGTHDAYVSAPEKFERLVFDVHKAICVFEDVGGLERVDPPQRPILHAVFDPPLEVSPERTPSDLRAELDKGIAAAGRAADSRPEYLPTGGPNGMPAIAFTGPEQSLALPATKRRDLPRGFYWWRSTDPDDEKHEWQPVELRDYLGHVLLFRVGYEVELDINEGELGPRILPPEKP